MRVIMLGVLLAACSDPTKVAPAPTVGALAGTVVVQANQHPVLGVQVTIRSTADTTYTAQETTDSLDSLLVAGFVVNGGLVDSTTVQLPCGS